MGCLSGCGKREEQQVKAQGAAHSAAHWLQAKVALAMQFLAFEIMDAIYDYTGVVEERSCRDVLFLLAFVAYWAGMFVVAAIAFKSGDPARLVYGIDSHGLLCGANNTYRNSTIDLTGKPYLYYLNALELLDATNLMYAKTVCVEACPGEQQLCGLEDLPCTNNQQYKCPYYRLAEQGLWGELPAVSLPSADEYWDQLPTATLDTCDSSFLQAAQSAAGINVTAAFGVDGGTCTAALAGTTGAAGRYLQARSQFPGEGPCYPVWAPTVPYFNRCFPRFPANFTSSTASLVDAGAGVAASAASAVRDSWGATGPQFSTYVADISKGLIIILAAGLGGGLVLSLLWMAVLRYLAGAVVWLAVAAANLVLAGCTIYAFSLAGLLTKAGTWGEAVAAQLPPIADPTGLTREHWKYIAYSMCGVTGAVLLITLVMIRRVRVAVACIKVASQAVAAMPSLLFVPLLPFILEVGLIVYWVAVSAVLYSAGTPTPHWREPSAPATAPLGLRQLLPVGGSANASTATPLTPQPRPDTSNMTQQEVMDACAASPDCYVSMDWDARLMYAAVYHLFGLLWTSQFIIGFVSVTIAGAVASHYWAAGDARRRPPFPVLRALRLTVVYHLGSIALGSFIIALVQLVRLLLEYLDKKTRAAQAKSEAARCAMCAARVVLCLLEKVVAFINRNAYIMVAVKGGGYCASAGRAVSLVVNNALRLVAVNVVGDAVLFLGKLGIAGACGGAAIALARLPYFSDATAYPATYLSSAILPVALSVLVGFVVAQMFFAVYEMAIDTVLLSFCEDCEANGGEPRCAPPLLLEAIGEASNAGARKPSRSAGA